MPTVSVRRLSPSHFTNLAWIRPALAACCILGPSTAVAQQPPAAQPADITRLSDEEQRQVQIAERFLTVLNRNPRRGTALDRVYGHHVEFGTLDAFLARLRTQSVAEPADGANWMLLGLFEAQRGEDASAAEAFRQAEQHRPEDGLASYYLGQSLLLLGEPAEAVEAFERALQRKPPRTDLLEIFRQLGRVHQRAQRTAEALAVWTRLEQLFPEDPRVLEQIAVTLVEEGEYAQALPRYERLAQLVKDDYRRTMFRIEAAQLKIRENREQGLQDFEQLLSDLNPEGWLFRDVRRRIEDVFLRGGDQDGLVNYYQRWLADHPEDVGAMARTAKYLASTARVPEAMKWMEQALKLAPSRGDLRKALIDQLVDDQRYQEAASQYQLLAESAPENQDYIRDWGRLVLKDKQRPLVQRKLEAARIWNRILAARPDDALTTAQVADLFRQAGMNAEALELYQRAVELAPADPQYREYLGEFHHILKRPDDALKTWQQIAAGPRRNAVNVARLAEVYNSFGYLTQAVEQVADACALDAKDFSLQIKASQYHSRAGKFDESLAFVDAADALAASDEERETALRQRIEVLQTSRRFEAALETLAQRVTADPASAAADWQQLARYYEAGRRWNDATRAIQRALQLEPQSVAALAAAARIAEMSGDYGQAAQLNRQLAAADRRARSDHLMNVARLEAQLGRADEALQAGRELIVAAPGNTDNYEFYAGLCFRLGKNDEGLDVLRKAVRINPTEPRLISSLGSALSEQFRTSEAIEVYWRAFDKSAEIDDKTSLTVNLTELYQQLNQFDKLIERFERDRRREKMRREMTICLAQAHQTSGDFGTARSELESLLSSETRDTSLLQQLSKLCEDGADLDAAVDYQRRLVSIAPGHETEYRLAGLLQQRGDREQASEILVKLTRREENRERLLRSIDSLLRQGSYDSVVAITEPLLAEQRDDWELLYRQGVAWALAEHTAEAKDCFRRILALNLPHETPSTAEAERLKRQRAKARSNNLRGIATQGPQQVSPLQIGQDASAVRSAVGLDPPRNYGSRGPQPVWVPSLFGFARMAAYGWLTKFQEQPDAESDADDLIKLEMAAAAADVDRNTLYDLLYVKHIQQDYPGVYRLARRFAEEGGREGQQLFLASLALRHVTSRGVSEAKKEPLGKADLELMLRCFQSLNEDKPTTAAQLAGMQVVYDTSGQAFMLIGGQWVAVASAASPGLNQVLAELSLAGRQQQAEQLLERQLQQAKSPSELLSACTLVFSQEKFDRLPELFSRWRQAAAPEAGQPQAKSAGSQVARAVPFLSQWMGHLGAEEENRQVATILDQCLDLAVQEARRRQAAAQSAAGRRRASSSSGSRSTYFTVYYGQQRTGTRLEYPAPNQYVDHASLQLLRQAFEVFGRNDVPDDLTDLLSTRVAAAARQHPENLPYEQLMLAAALWWSDDQQQAVELTTAAAEQLQNDPAFRLEVAGLMERIGDFDDALAIVDGIAARDQQLLQQRELTALRLAERLGDIDRARSAAERLFGLRMSGNEQLQLVQQMRRLGLTEMAEAMVARVQRRSGSQTTALPTLMRLYQGQGKSELAQQVAHTILRRSRPALSAANNSARNPLSYRSAADANRLQALQVLKQTGGLDALRQRLESQLQRSPESLPLYEQLIEIHQAANDRDKVRELLEQAIEHRPQATAMRYLLAKTLQELGKQSEACDQYLEILKRKPEWITEDFYTVCNVFDRAKRRLDLVKAFQEFNFKTLRQPHYVIDLVSGLLETRNRYPNGQTDAEQLELGLDLFEQIFEAFPTYRNNMITQIRSPALWKLDRVYSLGKRGMIPTPAEAAARPWFGVNSVASYSGGGKINSMFHQLLSGIKNTDKLADLEQSVQQALQQSPKWHGGQAMLALIELNSDRQQAAKQRLAELFDDPEVNKNVPSQAAWIVGQELDQFEDTRALAIRLLEQSVSAPSSTPQLEYSAVPRLADLYAKEGRQEDARELVLHELRKPLRDNYDPAYASYQRIENDIWAADRLLKLDCPVDAIRIYQKLQSQPQLLQQANARYGGRDRFDKPIREGLQQAVNRLEASDAEEAMAQLLAPEKPRPGQPLFDLMLQPPDGQKLQGQTIGSGLLLMLDSVSQTPELKQGAAKRLKALRQQHPTDLSIAIAEACYLLKHLPDEAGEALSHLQAVAANASLEPIPEGRRPNSRQRRKAARIIPLWLAAQKCLAEPSRRELGDALTQLALEGARRQINKQQAVAILYTWGQAALEAGDRGEAQRRWTALLEMATERPRRRNKSPATTQKTSFLVSPRLGLTGLLVDDGPEPAAAKRLAPLTISQFRIAIQLSQVAAENEMPELSRTAFRKSLEGGLPVPDPPPVGNAAQVPSPYRSLTPAMSSRTTPAVGPIPAEVAAAAQTVLRQWEQAGSYPAAEVCRLLLPLVLPPSRPDEILMYPDSSALGEAQVNSLGAALVRWSAAAQQLDALDEQIRSRPVDRPESHAASLVLRLLIALQQQQTDAARDRLRELNALIEQNQLPPLIELACHAALPAFGNDSLADDAMPILKAAVGQQNRNASQNTSSSKPALGRLASTVYRYLAAHGGGDEAQTFFDEYLVSRQAMYARYSGDYGQYLQMRDTAAIAEEAAKAGLARVAADFMGRVVEMRIGRYSRPSLQTPLAVVIRQMRAKSPPEQYAFWREWTLPVEGRRTVRLVAEWAPPRQIPPAFLSAPSPAATALPDLLCNLHELLRAAEEAGVMDQLRAEAEAAHDQQLPDAEYLLALALIRNGELEAARPLIAKLMETLPERAKRQNGQPTPTLWGDYLVYRQCLRQSQQFGDLVVPGKRALVEAARGNRRDRLLANVAMDFARRSLADRGNDLPLGGSSDLAHWRSAPDPRPSDGLQPWWVTQEGLIHHITGQSANSLLFDLPLTGDFEFSVDCSGGPWSEGAAGFGGVVVNAQHNSNMAYVYDANGHPAVRQPQALRRSESRFGRMTIQAAGDQLLFRLNGHVVYQAPRSITSPWLALWSQGHTITGFRNPQLSGAPQVPAEVPLLAGDQMNGWNSTFFGESQPRWLPKPTRKSGATSVVPTSPASTKYQWEAKDGELSADIHQEQPPDSQSWIYYHRPLQSGESFRYEFYYQPDKMVAHPTIGRVALLLAPAGVAEHWIARPDWDDVVYGVPLANEITEPANQRGPVPLKPEEWNQVELSLNGAAVSVSVNGKEVYQRPLDASNDRRFGLFRYQQHAVRVRGATLRGDWPARWNDEVRNNLAASTRLADVRGGAAINQLLTDVFAERDVDRIVATARSLPDAAAYDFLRQWVLPSSDHDSLRLYFHLPPIGRQVDDAAPLSARRLICPAIELVDVAARLKRLDELAEEVRSVASGDSSLQRGRDAMLTLLAIRSQDDKRALEIIGRMFDRLDKGLPSELTVEQRAPEVVVAWQATERPPLRMAAVDVALKLREGQRSKTTDADFRKLVESLVGQTRSALAQPLTAVEKLTQWQPVAYEKPQTRAMGWRPSQWRYSRGCLQHIPGEMWRQLFFQSPLRGKFEIHAHRSTHGHHEVSIAYGMHSAEPNYDLKSTRVSTVMHSSRNKAGKLEIPKWNDKRSDFRIVVDGSQITTYTDDVLVHAETLDGPPDPWVVLQAMTASSTADVRNLRIIGSPEIPAEIDLIAMAGWSAWRADNYGEWFSTTMQPGGNFPWRRVGDELHGAIRENISARDQESLLMYQRPMLEDGEIEFEAWFQPGEFEVHPAVGRSAFILRSEGASLHRLTDAQWELSDLAPDNLRVLSDKLLPLKAKQWNHYRLALVGDELTLHVNGEQVLRHALEQPPSRRFFGLFRYADRHQCRVRKLKYRGNWPKQLPTVAEQQLAYPAGGRLLAQPVRQTLSLPVNQPLPLLKKQGLALLGKPDQYAAAEGGLQLHLFDGDGWSRWPGVAYRTPVAGDYDVTVGFRDAEFVPPKQGWGLGAALQIELDDAAKSVVELGLFCDPNGRRYVKALHRHAQPNGTSRYDQTRHTLEMDGGRLRIARRGGEAYCLFAPAGGDFRLLQTFVVGPARTRSISMQNKCSDKAGKLKVLVEKLTLEKLGAAPRRGP